MSIVNDTVAWLSDSAHWHGDDGVPHRLLEHLGYTALTIGIAGAIAIPLGLWIGHTGRLRGGAVALTGALRALPTLGLLTFIVLYTGIGLTAPIIALTVLSIPPLLAGAYSGLEAVDRQTIDAARAVGMTEWQILTKVEVPLALPLIVGGIRSAALQVVATATVAAFVSLGGLGRYIIDGQKVSDYPQMVSGSVLVVALALVIDGIFAVLQKLALGARPSPQPSRA
ncbi:MAG: glycine/betaine transporter permease [Aeromicrobium sp.]|jgi:osmoprotectant transport system permease protein|uniref:ABC transporter permease n=1 Tax=Aeromicrobium sp. TaxID=1871063 RepID=UPI002621978D|nr:ABC transporter permease [Aeromicrobium sp.]MCW2825846.1 glycine/betaine transporter permease [Aeromicrobium sp.]